MEREYRVEAETFGIVELQVKQGTLHPAIESLEEFTGLPCARLRVSLFKESDVEPRGCQLPP